MNEITRRVIEKVVNLVSSDWFELEGMADEGAEEGLGDWHELFEDAFEDSAGDKAHGLLTPHFYGEELVVECAKVVSAAKERLL